MDQYQQAVVDAANKYGVDPDFALRIAHQESSFNPNIANSKAGAIGYMQLMPDTAKALKVNPYDPMQNIDGGVRYIKQMHDQFGPDQGLAAAAYNAGPGRLKQYLNGGRPLPAETVDYVNKTANGSDALALPYADQAQQSAPSAPAPAQSAISQALKMAQNSQALQNSYQGKTPMADNTPPALSGAAVAGGPSTLFGGNPTPIGGLGYLARMLGIGSEDGLGRHLMNAGAGLIAAGGKPEAAAGLQNAANMPLFRQRFTLGSDVLGNKFAFDAHTGQISPVGATSPGTPGASPGAPQSADPQEQLTQALANSPAAMLEKAKQDQELSGKHKEALEQAAVDAQSTIDLAKRQLELSKDPGVIQGPGIMNMLREKLSENTNGQFGGMDLAKQAEYEKNNGQLITLNKSALNGAKLAAPELTFMQHASADTEKPAAANQAIYQHIIENSQRAIHAAATARKYNVLGPAYHAEIKKYNDENPIYTDTQGPAAPKERPPLSDIFGK